MSDVFISYARSTQPTARMVANALRGLGYEVWLDDQLPAHRAYADVIEERLRAASAVVVIWSADATRSEWVRSEAELAREGRKLVQLTVDRARLPMPFNQIQCADLCGWTGEPDALGWRQVTASIFELTTGAGAGNAEPGVAPALEPPATSASLAPPPQPAQADDLRIAATKHADTEIRFRKQAFWYAVIMPGLVVLNLLTSPQSLWFQWPLFGWGFALAIQARRIYLTPHEDREALIARKMRKMRSPDGSPR